MRTVVEVFKNEIKKSYARSSRLQSNLHGIAAQLQRSVGGNTSYHVGKNFVNALYAVSKSSDVLVKQVLQRHVASVLRATDILSKDVTLPRVFYRNGIFVAINDHIQKIPIPQYYGGVRQHLGRGGILPMHLSMQVPPKSSLLTRADALWRHLTGRGWVDRCIYHIENEVVPHILANMNSLHKVRDIVTEDQLDIFEGFKNILTTGVGSSLFAKVTCVDICNIESAVAQSLEGHEVTCKMDTRFETSYYTQEGRRQSRFANYVFIIKFNCLPRNVLELVNIHFEPLRY